MNVLSLLKHGFTPTLRDFNQFLLFLNQKQRFKCIIHLCTQMSSNLIKPNTQTHKLLINALLNESQHDSINFLKTHIGKPNQNRIFDALIQGFCNFKDDPETGLFVLRESVRVHDFLPCSFTFFSLIYKFSSQGKMYRVVEVLELMSDEKFKYPFDNFVCSAVISGFLRVRKPELAIGFYENAVKCSTLKVNVVTYTAVLSAYCMLGKIEVVYDMVLNMEKDGLGLDVVFYSEWIHRLFKEGLVEEAFVKFKKMVEAEMEIDSVAYTILVDGFTKDGNVEKSVGFVSKMIKDGLKPNVVTYTALMLGFCKKGKLDEAFLLFEMVGKFGIKVDEFVYTILIDGVCRKGDFDRAFLLLEEMEKKEGIKPSVVTYNSIINHLCKFGRTCEGEDLSKGITVDVVTYCTLLDGYIKEGNCIGIMEVEKRFKESGISMDVVMCNTVLKSLFMRGLFDNALELFDKMPELGLVADSVTYRTLISGFFKAGRINNAVAVFNEYRQTSNSSSSCYRLMIRELCKNRMMDTAIEVFVEMSSRGFPVSRVLYTMLLSSIFEDKGVEGVLDLINRREITDDDLLSSLGNRATKMLSENGSFHAVIDVFTTMVRNGSFVSCNTYYRLLKNLVFDGKTLFTTVILATFLKQYGMSEPTVNRILVDYLCMKSLNSAFIYITKMKEQMLGVRFSLNLLETLARNGRVLDTYKLVTEFEDMLPDIKKINFCLIIDTLCKERRIHKALRLCNFVRAKNLPLDIRVYNVVINGLCLQGCIIEALRVYSSLEFIDLYPSDITYSTLITGLCREGLLLDARKVFDKMIKPNIRVYNTLIHGYCKFGQLEESLKLFLDLDLHRLEPDNFTVSSIIYGYCKNGDIDGAESFFYTFKEKGVPPDYLGFMYLVRGLFTKGRMEESRKILKEMLLTESVSDLLDRIECDDEIESVKQFLVFLCEKGRIHEAVEILNEVGSNYFFERGRIINENMEHLDKESCESMDFDSCYEFAAKLCSKGEISKANDVVKRLSGVYR